MMSIEEKVYNVIKERCEAPSNKYGIGAWDHHIKIVYELAKEYADEYDADLEIVAIAALLHDVASVTDVNFTEEHHIIGAKIAEEILLNENYPIEKITLIKKCILNHRGSRLADKTTGEEVCIADCDAMAHFYSIPSLLSMVYREKNLSIDEGLEKLKNLPYEDLGYANIDHHREVRTGYPEVIYCEGKSDEQILGIIEMMNKKKSNILGTRCRKSTYEKLKIIYPNAEYEEISKILKIKNHEQQKDGKGKIVIVTGGTSDIPVADEAYHTASFFGNIVCYDQFCRIGCTSPPFFCYYKFLYQRKR